MATIAILSDAHLLMQAEWIEDESKLTIEGEEVLENFQQAINLVKKDKPEVIVLAGDMFDYRTKSRQRVAHREGEKYMIKARSILEQLADEIGCKIYALKGNHDSEPVLRSTEKILKGKFVYVGNKTVTVKGFNTFFMNSHYVPGIYTIPLEGVPSNGDLLFMHESFPLFGTPAPSEDNFRSLCKRFRLVFNGHMHVFQTEPMKISNLFMIPALIPSREIKNNWRLKYTYPDGLEPEIRETPFGYLLLDNEQVKFRQYNPSQVVVCVEIKGDKTDDFLKGIREVYDHLSESKEKYSFRVWVKTNADHITIERIFWPTVREYTEIQTMDIIPTKREITTISAPQPEFGEKAFIRDELIEKVLSYLKGRQLEIARNIFDEIFTPEFLLSKRVDEATGFKKLIEILSRNYKVSEAFQTRAWELAKRRSES